jgi:hypothetical protein
MPFHEIREVNFTTLFNSPGERRQRLELIRETGKKRFNRSSNANQNKNPDKEVDFWA